MPKLFGAMGKPAVMRLVKREERPDTDIPAYAVPARVLYPWAIGRIRDGLAGGEVSDVVGLMPNADPRIDPTTAPQTMLATARRLGEQAFGDALRSRDDVDDFDRAALRAQALDLARQWFTRALKLAVGQQLILHITAETAEDKAYRQ